MCRRDQALSYNVLQLACLPTECEMQKAYRKNMLCEHVNMLHEDTNLNMFCRLPIHYEECCMCHTKDKVLPHRQQSLA